MSTKGNFVSKVIFAPAISGHRDVCINIIDKSLSFLYHFNPRFSEKCIVLNTMRNGIWEEEKRYDKVPFNLNDVFLVGISIESQGISICVDAKYTYYLASRCTGFVFTEIQSNREFSILDGESLIYARPIDKNAFQVHRDIRNKPKSVTQFWHPTKDQSILERVDYIIGYRDSSKERATALSFVLKWLCVAFPTISITIVEQDAKPSSTLKKLIALHHSNCRRVFAHNAGEYNRSWGFNIGLNQTDRDILVLADADMFLQPDDYLASLQMCLQYDVVDPQSVGRPRRYNVKIREQDDLTFDFTYRTECQNAFTGGIFMIQRQVYTRIAGFDETFRGWGFEDNALSILVLRYLKHISMDFYAYHVWHPFERGLETEAYRKNKIHFEKLSDYTDEELKHYVSELRQYQPGDINKYRAADHKRD